jgi:hypothetical protein
MLENRSAVELCGREHMDLRAASWEQTDRGGIAIWQSPKKGFYYAQEVAVEMDRGGAKP